MILKEKMNIFWDWGLDNNWQSRWRGVAADTQVSEARPTALRHTKDNYGDSGFARMTT
jgi:hypothetical protein